MNENSLRSKEADAVYANGWNEILFSQRWLGHPCVKNPLELFMYQEIMFEKRPTTIIETGTYKGGSAMFFASMMDMMKIDGMVYSMDIQENIWPKHDKIKYFIGSSTHDEIVTEITRTAIAPVMVVLDSDHDATHVIKELEKYHSLVSIGQYLVVEDTHWRPEDRGPWLAIQEFLEKHKNFVIDETKNKYGILNSPNGFLLKVEA